jgi:ribulose-5-phosphate 4-epimerase/fuculose-1-phosphate aldolase
MADGLDQVKYDVAVANRVLAEIGLATGVLASLGHASLRVPSQPDRFVVKGRGYAIDALTRMQPADMIVCDLDGYKVDGPPGATQCYEVKMHSCIYRARPDVQSIVHAHPRYVVALSVLRKPLVPMCQEGIDLVRRPLPLYPHVKTILSEEEGREVAAALGDAPALLLLGHGATTTGDSLSESVINMAWLEEQAKMNWYAYCAAGKDHPRIPEALIREMEERPPMTSLDHLKGASGTDASVRVSGTWAHYTELASRDL